MQHTRDLGHDALGVGRARDDPVRDDDLEAAVVVREVVDPLVGEIEPRVDYVEVRASSAQSSGGTARVRRRVSGLLSASHLISQEAHRRSGDCPA